MGRGKFAWRNIGCREGRCLPPARTREIQKVRVRFHPADGLDAISGTGKRSAPRRNAGNRVARRQDQDFVRFPHGEYAPCKFAVAERREFAQGDACGRRQFRDVEEISFRRGEYRKTAIFQIHEFVEKILPGAFCLGDCRHVIANDGDAAARVVVRRQKRAAGDAG